MKISTFDPGVIYKHPIITFILLFKSNSTVTHSIIFSTSNDIQYIYLNSIEFAT